MENKPKLSHHEAMELHELMNNYMVGIKHINAEMSKVNDEELKSFMEDSLNNKITKLQEISEFFNSGNEQRSEDSDENQDQNCGQSQYSNQYEDSNQNENQYQYQSGQNQSSQSSSSKG